MNTGRYKRTLLLLAAACFVTAAFGLVSLASAEVKSISVPADKDVFRDDTGIYDSWHSAEGYTLYLGNIPGYGLSEIAMGFDLTGLLDGLTLHSACIYFKNNFSSGSPRATLYGSVDDSWDELSGTDFPPKDTGLIGSRSVGGTGWRYTSDCIDFVAEQYAGDQYATLVISSSSSSGNFCIPYASEQDTDRPYLKVYYTIPSVEIAAASSIREGNIDGMDVELTLNDETFTTSALTPDMFTLPAYLAACGVTVASAGYTDETHATLTLSLGGDFDEHTGLTVSVDGAVLSYGITITSNELEVRAIDEITEGGAYDLDTFGVEADIVVSTTEHVTLMQTSPEAIPYYQISYSVSGADLEIDGIRIDNNMDPGIPGITFTGDGNALTLTGDSFIDTYNRPAVGVMTATTLTINGTGSLTAVAHYDYSAAIGGGNYNGVGTIIIDGGTINATGSYAAAGIGGGYNNVGGAILINGGVVTAHGGENAAGIGSGYFGSAACVTINGGTVNATGGECGAGIGSGENGSIDNVTINGGTVTALGGSFNGAGIGSGYFGSVSLISITGGTITAGHGEGGAGVGSGPEGEATKISISGGVISTSCGNGYNVAIGGGQYANVPAIEITGGLIYAEGDGDSPCYDIGIFDGDAVNDCQVSISSQAIVFLKNNRLEDRNDDITLPFYSNETITNHMAYGYPVPDDWSGTAYAYIASSILVTDVTVEPETATLILGDGNPANNTVTLTANVIPPYADNTAVTWLSSDSAIASVDGSGVVTAAGEGTAAITARTVDGWFTDTCTVTVEQRVTGVSVAPKTASLILGDGNPATDTVTLTATISPLDATNQAVAWSTSVPGIVSVDAAGVVTALAKGDVIVTARTADGGYEDNCMVTVYQHITGVSMEPTACTLVMGDESAENDSIALTAIVYPQNANNPAVTWSSSAPSVASVDASGVVTAVSKGTAVITATTVDMGYTATCDVTVEYRVMLDTSEAPNGKVCLGCSFTIMPSLDGGVWTFDPTLLSCCGNTFIPLKVGTTVLTYSLPNNGAAIKPGLLRAFMDCLCSSACAENVETADFTVTVEKLALVSSEDGPYILMNQMFTLTPNFAGGSWAYDNKHLQRNGNEFLPIGLGQTTVTYTYRGQSTQYTLIIYLEPLTGDARRPWYLYAGAALLAAGLLTGFAGLRRRIL